MFRILYDKYLGSKAVLSPPSSLALMEAKMKRQGKATIAMINERRFVNDTDTSPPAKVKINTTPEIKIAMPIVHYKLARIRT